MPHADSSLVPSSITSKTEFWKHVHSQLELLLKGERNWVTNLANAASLIFNSLLDFPTQFGKDDDKAVNWCGFYIAQYLFPAARHETDVDATIDQQKLLLGPFCGKPACQFINIYPKPRGVCADAFSQRKTLVVPNVDLYPGHIACDGETKSEIVCPLIVEHQNRTEVIGVLDLDCLRVGAFDSEDEVGLVRIARLIVDACDW